MILNTSFDVAYFVGEDSEDPVGEWFDDWDEAYDTLYDDDDPDADEEELFAFLCFKVETIDGARFRFVCEVGTETLN